MSRGSIAALPNLRHAIGDEELSPAPPPPTEPPPPPPPPPPGSDGDYIIAANGARYPADAQYLSSYSGGYTWNPNVSSYGSAFTYTAGTWYDNSPPGNAKNRQPVPGDQARLSFAGGETLYAGKIDNTDLFEMNRAGNNQFGVPEQNNVIIITGVPVNDGPFDPAVFPKNGAHNFPSGDGPHRHSMATAASSFWTADRLKGDVGGRPSPTTDLANPFLRDVMQRTEAGFGFKCGMLMYWPTFTDGIPNNGRRHSGYIGRPRARGIALNGLSYYDGDVVPPPYGLRMFSFNAAYFNNQRSQHEFVVCFPCCWDGQHEWLPEGAHMAFLDNGRPPATHPYVIPQIHWFVTVDRLRSQESMSQMTARSQSAQEPDGPGGFWNYSGDIVPLHAECMLAWDPIFAEAMAWMINARAGLGRVGDIGVV